MPGEVLIRGGKIVAVGPKVEAPAGAEIIDAPRAHLTPGIIDTHSHLGVYPSPGLVGHSDGNEVGAPVTAEVQSAHGFWPQDPQLRHALAGGVTTMQILPGSANLIGGRAFTIKNWPGRSAREMRFPGAPDGLKLACGENPKRVYGGERKGLPSTRMGNVAGYRTAFQNARAYREKWEKYRKRHADWEKAEKERKGPRPPGGATAPDPPERDLRLETLAEVLRGNIYVQNHCYRADEMAQMLDLAREFGFQIRSFHHAVEAYKIRDLLAQNKVGVSTWADWWGFKIEAFDGIMENAAMLAKAGVPAIIHSDSAVGIQRLNQEAAKAYYKGRAMGIDLHQEEALRWVTANPAWALGVLDRVGTIEPGKLADLVLWSAHPLSVYALADQVFIDGHVAFDRARGPRRSDFELGIIEERAP
jgi:imidazolonepropionase-like amidohydrolase